MATERKLIESGETKVYVRRPTLEESRLGDVEYSKAYNEHLKSGLPLSEELEKTLSDRGILGPAFEEKLTQAGLKMQEAIFASREEQDVEKRKVLVEQYKVARLELFELNRQKSSRLLHTVESKADESKVAFLISRVTQKEDGSLQWANYDALKSETNQQLISAVVFGFLTMLNNIPDNYLNEDPEFEALKPEVETETDSIVEVVETPKVVEVAAG